MPSNQWPSGQKYCPLVWNNTCRMATCKPAKSTLMYVGPSTTMHSNLIYKFSVKRVQTMSMLQFPQVSLLIRLTVHLNFSHISRFHGLLSPSLRCCSRISSHQIIGIPTPPCVLLYFPVKTPANPIWGKPNTFCQTNK